LTSSESQSSKPSLPNETSIPQRASAISSLTQQPFGETEEQVQHDHSREDGGFAKLGDRNARLGDVDYLDLNAPASEEPLSNEEAESTQQNGPTDSSVASASAVSPSSLLDTATSMLPSIPFLSSSSSPSSKSASSEKPSRSPSSNAENREAVPSHHQVNEKAHGQSAMTEVRGPPNPMVAQPGESTDLARDDTLSSYTQAREQAAGGQHAPDGSDKLPKIEAGEGEGPNVVYGKDVVLDMAGYKSHGKFPEVQQAKAKTSIQVEEGIIRQRRAAMEQVEEHKEQSTHPRLGDALIDTFVQDLLMSIHSSSFSLEPPLRPILPAARATDSALPQASSSSSKDGLDPTTSMPDLPRDIASLSLESNDPVLGHSPSPSRRRRDRGQSEPPREPEDDMDPMISIPVPSHSQAVHSSLSPLSRSPNGALFSTSTSLRVGASSRAAMDLAWDWGRIPNQPSTTDDVQSTRQSFEMERSFSGPPAKPFSLYGQLIRSDSMPPAGLDLAVSDAHSGSDESSPGKLKNIEDSPFIFILDMEGGGSHTFELALCGEKGFAPHGEASVRFRLVFGT